MGFRPFIYTTPQYGEKEYERAYQDWQEGTSRYSDLIRQTMPQVSQAATEARGLTDYYRPGGGYGGGLRQEARETVGQGVAQASTQMVGSGMSSMFGSRGINVLAGAELSKLYKNIEDTRAQLLSQAFTPYAQMIQTLGNLTGSSAQLATSQPTRNSYVSQGQSYISGFGREL